VDVMLSRPEADFDGGAFLTKEHDGSVRSHAFYKGDAVVFVSHKPHFVAPVPWSSLFKGLVTNIIWA
jgi:hypothetical protein